MNADYDLPSYNQQTPVAPQSQPRPPADNYSASAAATNDTPSNAPPVTTRTTYTNNNSSGFVERFKSYSLSLNGLMKIVEIVILLFALIFAAASPTDHAPRGFFIFVSFLFFLLTTLLFLVYALRLHHKVNQVPWLLIENVFNGIAILLLFLASVILAAKNGGKALRVLAAVLGFISVACYGVTGFLGFLEWRAGGDPAGNVAA